MGIYYNPGNQGFESALHSKIYVDKSELILYTNSVIETEQRYICASRPRRFGKSITAEMLVAYYNKGSDSKKIFQNLKVSHHEEYEKYINQYEVIYMDINSFRNQSQSAMEAVENMHKWVIEELLEVYGEVLDGENSMLQTVLYKINKKTGAKFIIIIDEWDAIFREDKMDEQAQRAYITLLRGLFKDAPSKRFLSLAYMTGILPIKKYGTESALNNFDEFTMTGADIFAEYIGFTEQEVRELCCQYDMDFEEIKKWYDGYLVGKDLHVYNPKSVVDSLRRKRIANYWTNTENYEALKNYINMNFDGLKNEIVQMLAGNRCKVNANKFQNDFVSFRSKDDILTLLIHLGYLSYDMERQEVTIPNEEIREVFMDAMEDTGWDTVIQSIIASDELLKATWRGDEDEVARGIDFVHTENTSLLTYNDENSLSCVISLAYYNAVKEYQIIREMPAGKGYADLVFLPRKNSDRPAMIVELKWNDTVSGAIEQIKGKEYIKALKTYHGTLLLVGINYNKKSKKHECCIERINMP